MKKTNKLALGLSLASAAVATVPVILPRKASADMGAPYAYTLEYIVTNPNGAKCTGSDGGVVKTLSEGTKFKAMPHFAAGASTEPDHYTLVDENNLLCAISLQDVAVADKNFDMSTIKKESNPLRQYIISNESYLYKGPGEQFGKVDDGYHLPQGIVVSADYYDDFWMYVSYEGHTGWINHRNVYNAHSKTADIATSEWSSTLVTTRSKIELKDTPYEDGKVIATIEVAPPTELPVLYTFSLARFESQVYISYGDKAGWYHKNALSYDVASPTSSNYTSSMVAEEGKAIVSEFVDSGATVATIPANTDVRVLYTASNQLGDEGGRNYIEWYDNGGRHTGWVNAAALANYISGNDRQRTAKYDRPVFDAVNGKETGDVIAANGGYFANYYYRVSENEVWYRVSARNDSIKGWIKELSDDEIKELEKQKIEAIEDMIANPSPEDPSLYTDEHHGYNSTQTIIWLLVCCGLLAAAITALIIIRARRNGEKANDEKADKGTGAEDGKDESADKPAKEEPKTEE